MNERQKAWNKWVVMAPKNIRKYFLMIENDSHRLHAIDALDLLSTKDLAAVEEFLEEQQ
tara:strand:- start:90 stop:266 length:177 start_codon:yes stop_codon:yes gene_type:complete